MKMLVIVPAFNEAQSIQAVLLDLRKHGYRNILVVDDGSTDATGGLAAKEKVAVVRHFMNRGLGAALGTGFDYAKKAGADVVVTFDADGQHEARDIKKLLGPIRRGKADVVIGSRLLGRKNMPWDRKILNLLSNILTFLLFRVWTTDSQSGLRAFNKKATNLVDIRTERMEVSSEFFKEIRDNRLRFTEVPIRAIYTAYGLLSSKQENMAALKISLRLFLRLFR